MLGANSGRPARQYLAALGDIPFEFRGVFVINVLTFIYTELAYLPAFTIMRSIFSFVRQSLNLLNTL